MGAVKELWESTLLMPGETDLTSSVLRELGEYFPHFDPNDIEDRFQRSSELLTEDWLKKGIDPRSEESLIRFYNETEIEMFELMHYHSVDVDLGPLNYVYALELAHRHGCTSYLDYGSGVGSGGILFARSGFQVTLCDVSTPLLDFAKWRFERRKLNASYIDLKKEEPKNQVDFITCFEVLEHAKDPLALLRKIHRYLRVGGLLVVTAPFSLDESRPMHIVHNHRLIERFRGQGFHMRWDLKDQFRGRAHEPFFVMQKVERSRLGNWLYEAFDYYVPDSVKSAAFRIVKRKAKHENFVHRS